MSITAEQMLAIGGRAWTSRDGSKHRIYLNPTDEDLDAWLGLAIERYKSGNISYASLRGEKISNAKAQRFAAMKIWWEAGVLFVEADEEVQADVYAAIVSRLG